MRKFKRFWPHAVGAPVESRPRWARSHPLRSLLVVMASALIFTGFTAPSANAFLMSYFNFEDAVDGGPPDLTPDMSLPTTSILTISSSGGTEAQASSPGIALNVAPGDPDPNLLSTAFRHTATGPVNITFSVSTIGFTGMSLSFANLNHGNGFNTATLSYSLNGVTFTTIGTVATPTGGPQLISFPLPTAANNQLLVFFRITLSGGQSNGNDVQSTIDNIRLDAAFPEPATVVGGLLGVVGLGWHQRRRLIRSVRLRRT
jgi:hypothetical protein